MKRNGLSPVVATVLLIGIVIVLALIIYLWARGFVSESVEKFGRAVELSCDDVVFDAEIFGSELEVINRANVPIYGFEVKEIEEGNIVVSEVSDNTIGIGESLSIDLAGKVDVGSGKEFNVIPVILGESDTGKVTFTCPDENGLSINT